MTIRTTSQNVGTKPRNELESHRVVWVEIPQRPEAEHGIPDDTRHELAAMSEEPERWDGMA